MTVDAAVPFGVDFWSTVWRGCDAFDWLCNAHDNADKGDGDGDGDGRHVAQEVPGACPWVLCDSVVCRWVVCDWVLLPLVVLLGRGLSSGDVGTSTGRNPLREGPADGCGSYLGVGWGGGEGFACWEHVQ